MIRWTYLARHGETWTFAGGSNDEAKPTEPYDGKHYLNGKLVTEGADELGWFDRAETARRMLPQELARLAGIGSKALALYRAVFPDMEQQIGVAFFDYAGIERAAYRWLNQHGFFETCGFCGGTGRDPISWQHTCRNCGGHKTTLPRITAKMMARVRKVRATEA